MRIAVIARSAGLPRLAAWFQGAGQALAPHATVEAALAAAADVVLLQDDAAPGAEVLCALAARHPATSWVFTGERMGPQARTLAAQAGVLLEFLREPLDEAEAQALLARLQQRRCEREVVARLQDEGAALRREQATLWQRLSHDLQGVLQNVDGFASALEAAAAARLSEREARFLGRIRSSAQRGNGMLLDLTTLAGVFVAPLQTQRVDCASLVRRCIEELQPALDGRRLDWQLGPLPVLRGDPALLHLALRHLLANAAKFTRDCPHAVVEVRCELGPDSCELQVRDNGAGFDAGYADRLFAPFERLHPPQAFEGRGIGLALVRTVARRHGGDVRCEGAVGRGALFALRWPRSAVEEESPAPAPPPAPIAAADPPRPGAARKLRLLLVDDDPLVVLTLQNMLARDGHEVHCASGGRAGVEAVRSAATPFDLILCDWSMPDLDGGQVALAAKRAAPHTAVILLTGRRPDVEEGQDCPDGVDRVLSKPVRAAELREAVASVAPRA